MHFMVSMITERLRRYASKYYDRMVLASRVEYWRERSQMVPPSVQRYFVNYTGYEYASTIGRMLEGQQRILVIGDGGGRDFYWLRMHGKEVYSLDIAPQSAIDKLVIADASFTLPFP